MSSKSTRKIDNINWRLVTYLLIIPILLFYALALNGCEQALSNIYSLKLQYNQQDLSLNSAYEVRIAYFGICAGTDGNLECRATPHETADSLTHKFSKTKKSLQTPALEHLVSIALTLQTRVILYLFLVAGLFFFIALLALAALKRDLKSTSAGTGTGGHQRAERRRRFLKRALLTMTWASLAFAIVAAVSVNQTAAALQYFTGPATNSPIEITGGAILQVFQWLVVGFSFAFAYGVSSIYQSENGAVESAGGDSAGSGGGAGGLSGTAPLPPGF